MWQHWHGMNYPAGKFYDDRFWIPVSINFDPGVFITFGQKILGSINDELLKAIPDAIIFGSTSVGEIMHGLLQVGTTVLSISFFTKHF